MREKNSECYWIDKHKYIHQDQIDQEYQVQINLIIATIQNKTLTKFTDQEQTEPKSKMFIVIKFV